MMRTLFAFCVFGMFSVAPGIGQPARHPDTSAPGWSDVFEEDLANAIKPDGVWSFENGELTAAEDQHIWSARVYDNFTIDLEFKTADGTNSGVILYGSDIVNWVPNSVEVQIADDYNQQWAESPATWQCGAIFGHLAASKRMVKPPGEWNRYTITAIDQRISVILNGERVVEMDMSKWTSATTNPDGTEIPPWLSTPLAELPTYGHIGLQGKHAGAPIWFRNIRILEHTHAPSVDLPPPIARVLRDYEEAWQARNASALAALFSEDGFILRPGHDPVRGRSHIEAAYRNAGGPLFLRALDYAVSGDVGYIIGVYSASAYSPDRGKFVLALRRDPSGRWMIQADMDNGNQAN